MGKKLQFKMPAGRLFAAATVAAASCLFVGAQAARASALNPGSTVSVTPETLAGDTLVADTGVLPYSTPRENGTYESRVFEEADGNLDFVYDFSDSATSIDGIRSVTMASFQGFAITDAAYDSTSGGVAPLTASLDNSGSVPRFQFSDAIGVPPGSASASLILRTNAKSFDANGFYTLQDGSAANLTGFEPAAVPIPAPLAASSVLLGLFGLVKFRRSRRTA